MHINTLWKTVNFADNSSLVEQSNNYIVLSLISTQEADIKNQWTVPVEWNTGMEYLNHLNYNNKLRRKQIITQIFDNLLISCP